MKLLVPLRMAWIDWIWLAASDWLMAAMMGMPPATAASKAIERPSCRARSNSSGPCSASRALLAVTTSLPLSSSFNMIVRSGSSPPINCTTAAISGLFSTFDRSLVKHARGQRDVSRPRQVRIDHLDQFQPLAGVPGNALAVLQQQSRHARPDGPETDNGNFGGFHG